jgi:hypothetical protein
MFVFNRSAYAVLAPLALLMIAAWWSNRAADAPSAQADTQQASRDQALAVNLPSR